MSDFKDKAKQTINAAAQSAKKTSDKMIDKSREAAHTAGKTLVKQGKRLQGV